MDRIPFNVPAVLGTESSYITKVFENKKFCGDGYFTKKVHQWLEDFYKCPKALLTTSCTHALEMCAILAGIKPGDEVILPSFTFVSTANAFALRGAQLVFVDIEPNTMCITSANILKAISAKTKAVVMVHYAGFSSDIEKISEICKANKILLIEDAAQAIDSTYNGKLLGTFGTFSTLSFHETKNIQCGEGGALIINDSSYVELAEIIREKGTDRTRFFRGQVDKYTWQSIGSSWLPSELNAAFLLAQLEGKRKIQSSRLKSWHFYDKFFENHFPKIERIQNAKNIDHNAHLYWIKLRTTDERNKFIDYMTAKGIQTAFHYVPLHSSPAGQGFGKFYGEDNYTSIESARLVRLPLYFDMETEKIEKVCDQLSEYLGAYHADDE